MTIRIRCCRCPREVDLADEMAGRFTKCPDCNTMVYVPVEVEDSLPGPDERPPETPLPPDLWPRKAKKDYLEAFWEDWIDRHLEKTD